MRAAPFAVYGTFSFGQYVSPRIGCKVTTTPRDRAARPRRALRQASVQVKRVRLSRGASRPGRGPRWTSSTGGRASRTSARRAAPMPSWRQRGEMPDHDEARVRDGVDELVRVGEQRAPRRRRRRAGRRATRRRAGGSRRGGRCAGRRGCRRAAAARRSPRRAQAPSSSAAQSCSPPPNGTWTPRAASGASPESTATCAGERSSSSASGAGSCAPSRSGGASTSTRSASFAVASRTRSAAGSSLVNAAVRARDRCGATAAVRRRELVLARDEPREHELGRERARPAPTSAPTRSSRDGADEHRAPRAPAPARAGLERGIVRQDRALERLQRRRRLEPEALDERLPRRAVRLERLGLPSRRGRARASAGRGGARAAGARRRAPRARRRAPRGGRARAPPRSAPRAPRAAAPRAARTAAARERLVGEVGERRPAPEAERLAEQRRPPRPASSPTRARSASPVSRSKRARSNSSSRTRST